MKTFPELHALGLFDAGLKLMLREDLRLSELNLHVNLAKVFLEFHGEYWEFSLLALQLNVEDINWVHGLFGPCQKEAGVYINRWDYFPNKRDRKGCK